MVDVEIDELEEETESEPTEAEQAEKANKSVTAQLEAFKKQKEALKNAMENIEETKDDEVEKEPEPEVKPKETRLRTEMNVNKLNIFKTKIIKDFGLTESLDRNECFVIKYEGFTIFKILPRRNCWYGVWREVPEEDNKWRTFRVYNEDDEQTHYDHVKLFIEANNE